MDDLCKHWLQTACGYLCIDRYMLQPLIVDRRTENRLPSSAPGKTTETHVTHTPVPIGGDKRGGGGVVEFSSSSPPPPLTPVVTHSLNSVPTREILGPEPNPTVNVDTVSGNLMGLRQGQSVANPSPTRRSVGSHICIKRGRLSPQQFLVD